VVGGRADKRLAVEIRAEAHRRRHHLRSRVGIRFTENHTGLRERSEGRGQCYDLRFLRTQAWSDPGLRLQGSQRPTLPHAPGEHRN
jgi:hypothetical protein